ncbi:MAG: adenylosuccinate lyase [Flaviramulus sp.]|nr:adenylosuccinate lyase [Flaviramulus sp.]
MTLEEFYKELSFVDASKKSRLKYADMVLKDMNLFPKLLEIMFMVDDKVSYRAAWVFEFVINDNIYALVPHLDFFTKNIHKIHLNSAVRPVAKVCQFIATTFSSKQQNTIKKTLLPVYEKRIVESCFDWLISNQKTATKAYTMETLFLFGKNSKWIYEELSEILQQNFQSESAGYKSRAKHILKKIKKIQ